MSAELRQLWGQREALDALEEALRTQDGWLSYRAEALRDQLLEHEGQAAARPLAIERICTALIDRDEALQQARGIWRRCAPWRPTGRQRWGPSGPRTGSSARGSGRRSPSRAGPPKEADELKAALATKVAALATTEEQLRQERAARQEAEGQLQQERGALADARSALERERTALAGARKSLEERDAEVSRLDGELIALSIWNTDQERSLEEQGVTIISLQQAVEAERRALEVEKKQVEGKSPLCFLFC
jgi:DNA repair exonuclease SbcCD ATPase subunit